MDWAIILPIVVSFIQNFSKTVASPTPPLPLAPVPSAAIKDLQTLLNVVLGTNLEVDGWLGPETEAAIEQGIAKLHSLGVG